MDDDIQGSTGDGGDALHILSGNVCVYDSELEGGEGGIPYDGPSGGGHGGDAAEVAGGAFLFISGSILQGASGGNSGYDEGLCKSAGHGGSALVPHDGSQALELDCVLHAGKGGGAPCGWGDGAPGRLVAGDAVELRGPPRSLALTTPLKELESGTLTLQGGGGDLVLLMVSGQNGFEYVPEMRGVLALGADRLMVSPRRDCVTCCPHRAR